MRRLRYAKYIITFIASAALTFHLLHSGIKDTVDKNSASPPSHQDTKDAYTSPRGYSFTKSNSSYLLRKLSQGSPTSSPKGHVAPKWIVLPGNVTVHEGQDNIPYEVNYEKNAEIICKTFDKSRRSLLIFVASSANHFFQRQSIRETWGFKLLQDAHNYRVVFLVGKSDEETESQLVHESYRYGDLVQLSLKDSFRNLGRKSVAGLQWTKAYCENVDFVMKTDDDILIHIPNLLDAINDAKNPDSLLMCHENRMRKILRKELLDDASLPMNYHKYEVSENELPGEYYPPYCSGMAYVFSSSVRDRLVDASKTTPIFFIEDVYLTGFCRHKAGVIITQHPGITLRPPISVDQAICTFRDGRITSQEVGVEELRQLWAELNTQGFFCPQLVGYARKQKHLMASKK